MKKITNLIAVACVSLIPTAIFAADSSDHIGIENQSTTQMPGNPQQSMSMQDDINQMKSDMNRLQADMMSAKTPEAMQKVMQSQMQMIQKCIDMMQKMQDQMMKM